MILGILEGDSKWELAIELDHKGVVSTGAPDSLLKLFFEAF